MITLILIVVVSVIIGVAIGNFIGGKVCEKLEARVTVDERATAYLGEANERLYRR